MKLVDSLALFLFDLTRINDEPDNSKKTRTQGENGIAQRNNNVVSLSLSYSLFFFCYACQCIGEGRRNGYNSSTLPRVRGQQGRETDKGSEETLIAIKNMEIMLCTVCFFFFSKCAPTVGLILCARRKKKTIQTDTNRHKQIHTVGRPHFHSEPLYFSYLV